MKTLRNLFLFFVVIVAAVTIFGESEDVKNREIFYPESFTNKAEARNNTTTSNITNYNPYVQSSNTITDYSFLENKNETTSNYRKKEELCHICYNSKKCSICNGWGSFQCLNKGMMYCLRGECTACDGTGVYKRGYETSRCPVCQGKGIHDYCNGTGRYKCKTCGGDGICTFCE